VRDFATIASDLRRIVDLHTWKRLRQAGRGPNLRRLEPWVRRAPKNVHPNMGHAVVEFRDGSRLRYLVPETGVTFWSPA